ncbi:MAG TPA: PQQ-dependent sugar dehydrogenase [Terriglobales bacterium]|nr:PQQ-dependent sugar dehydrogenase [Terriglobales bacterium]
MLLKAFRISPKTVFFAAVLAFFSTGAMAAPVIALQPVVSGLTNPLDLETPNDGTGRLFVLEQAGKIRVIKSGKLLSTPFLNITSLVSSGGEMGLLGLAFHPSYKSNGRLFINYTRVQSGQVQTVIAEYHRSSTNADVASTTAKVLLVINQPYDNHNGGQLAFGPDGYLYIGLGDGGSEGDPLGNGQKLSTLLGKILRINVNSGTPYSIPSTNPFVGRTGVKPEIWAYGFRNPWRFGFDFSSGRLFIGDVGQDSYEEIDLGKSGGNFGWSLMEGAHCYPIGSTCNKTGKILPITEIAHPTAECIIGGYVYRGSSIAGLAGMYVFGDFITGKIWALKMTSTGWQRSTLLSTGRAISAFGRDYSGNLYVVDYGNGSIFKIVQG